MPTYKYKCTKCSFQDTKIHGMSEKPDYSCEECGSSLKKAIGLNKAGTITKGITPSKAWSEKRRRAKESALREVRQLERWGAMSKVAPNYNGKEVNSWEEAKKLASENGGDTSSYDSYIKKEKNSQNSAGIDEERWKKAKENAKK
jgi:putative FmdB family regulatory protein